MILENLKISLNAVVPMFILIAVGYLVRAKGMLDDHEARRFNAVLFNVFAPCFLFNSSYGKDLGKIVNGKLLTFVICMALFNYVWAYIYVTKVEKEDKRRGAMIHAMFRANTLLLGIPLATNLTGPESAVVISMIVIILSPVQSALAVFTLERFRGRKATAKQIIVSMLKNPFIIGSVLGIISALIKLKLPGFIETPIKNIAGMYSYLALILLGASLNFENLKGNRASVIRCVVVRLIVSPILSISLGILLGFRGIELIALIAVFAAPTAVVTFTMAQQMESDENIASSAVITSTIFSCITMFLAVFILKTFNLM